MQDLVQVEIDASTQIWTALELVPSVIISHPINEHALGRVIVELAPSVTRQDLRSQSPRRRAPYRLIGSSVARDIKPPRGISLYAAEEIHLSATVKGLASLAGEDKDTTTTFEIMSSSPLFPKVGQ